MVRFKAVQFLIFIGFFVQNLIYLVECEDKRIIIYVPRRVKTVHHHHHHVVLMDPKKKMVMHTKPYPDRSSSSLNQGYQQIQARDHQQQYIQHHHMYHQQQHQQLQDEQQHHQSMAPAGHPSSYLEQRKTIGPNMLLYPATQLPIVHVPVTYTTWPARKKRSKFVARLYTH